MLKLLRQLLRRKPFRPVCVVMSNGNRFVISDPERVAITRTRAFVFLPPRDRFVELTKKNLELVYEPRRARQM